jgi:hypothetical protein
VPRIGAPHIAGIFQVAASVIDRLKTAQQRFGVPFLPLDVSRVKPLGTQDNYRL